MVNGNLALSVVVPTFNQADLLDACLASLTEQTLDPQAYEIVVVDDGSTDGTGDVVARKGASYASIQPIRFPQNRGRSAARNAGIEAAAAPLIVFVDSDVVVLPDFLQSHLAVHRRHGSGILCRGPVVLVTDPHNVRRHRVSRLAASPAFLDTANASVEKRALVAAGLFDESFPGYGWEDFEMGIRLKRLGIRRIFSRQAVAYHIQPLNARLAISVLLRKEEDRARSAVHFFRRHPTLEARILIQATPAHRILYWMGAIGGRLRPESARNLASRLEAYGAPQAANLVLRAALNWHYSNCLQAELARAA